MLRVVSVTTLNAEEPGLNQRLHLDTGKAGVLSAAGCQPAEASENQFEILPQAPARLSHFAVYV